MNLLNPTSLIVNNVLDMEPEGLAGLGHHVLRQGVAYSMMVVIKESLVD